MQALKTFFLAFFSGIAGLALFAAFIGFVDSYFGMNAASNAIWISLGLFFIAVAYFKTRNKNLSHAENIKNMSVDMVKSGINTTKAIIITIGVIILLILAVGAFMYIAGQIGKLGASGIIIILLVIISIQLAQVLDRMD